MRELRVEAAEEHHRSPRVSKEWTTGEVQELQQYGDDLAAGVSSKLNGANLQQQQDNLAVAQNGGLTGSTAEDADMADAEGDDGMDDDMMDKISSSPSIDDGGYIIPPPWPQRFASLTLPTPIKSRSVSQTTCGESSSPFVETPEHFPLGVPPDAFDKRDVQDLQVSKYCHQGEFLDQRTTYSESNYDEDKTEDVPTPASKVHTPFEVYDEDFDLDQFSDDMLAEHVDMLAVIDDDGFDPSDPESYIQESHSGLCRATTEIRPVDQGRPSIFYEEFVDEKDDDFNFSLTTCSSTRVDSGWGGECLQTIEDIDFEFVYALHTFVATVEGQANATKGDTMVLLDDSNSYWWLVRVVKDSSIGQ